MPQTALALSLQHALLLHVSRFYRAPLPTGWVPVPLGCHTLLLAALLFSGSGSAARAVAEEAGVSLVPCCSAAAFLHRVGKPGLPQVCIDTSLSSSRWQEEQDIRGYFQSCIDS